MIRDPDAAAPLDRPLAAFLDEYRASSGDLLIVSAASGTGKTTLLRTAFERVPSIEKGLAYAVSHTTRAPRPGEIEGRHYHFVDRETFEEMIEADAFLEHAEIYGNRYGTSLTEVERRLATGRDVILEIDVQGAAQVRRRIPAAVSIFLLPPSFEALEARLRGRGSESLEQVETRLAVAVEELHAADAYDYVIVNDDLDRACEALAAVLLAGRFRCRRMRRAIDRIQATLPPAMSS